MKLGAGLEGLEEGVSEALLPSEAADNGAEHIHNKTSKEEEQHGGCERYRVEVKFEDPWRRMDASEILKSKRRNRDLICHAKCCK